MLYCKTTIPPNKGDQLLQQKTYNVTNLTQKQRHQLIQDAMNQDGFTALIKKQNNNEIHYTFQYKN